MSGEDNEPVHVRGLIDLGLASSQAIYERMNELEDFGLVVSKLESRRDARKERRPRHLNYSLTPDGRAWGNLVRKVEAAAEAATDGQDETDATPDLEPSENVATG